MIPVRFFAFVLAAGACHRGGGDPRADIPSSCVIAHDGGVTQCFEEIGATAKSQGEKACSEMHGDHEFRVAQPCPPEARLGSCTKRAGTDLERVEYCYRDVSACEARCGKAGGSFVR